MHADWDEDALSFLFSALGFLLRVEVVNVMGVFVTWA